MIKIYLADLHWERKIIRWGHFCTKVKQLNWVLNVSQCYACHRTESANVIG